MKKYGFKRKRAVKYVIQKTSQENFDLRKCNGASVALTLKIPNLVYSPHLAVSVNVERGVVGCRCGVMLVSHQLGHQRTVDKKGGCLGE